MRMLDESSEIAQVGCIEDVTSDLRENYMKSDTEGNGKETEEGLLGEPKPVQVLQKIKILVFTCFYLQYDRIYCSYIVLFELNYAAYTFFIDDTILQLTSLLLKFLLVSPCVEGIHSKLQCLNILENVANRKHWNVKILLNT